MAEPSLAQRWRLQLTIGEPWQAPTCPVLGDPSPPAVPLDRHVINGQSASHARSIDRPGLKTLGLWDKGRRGLVILPALENYILLHFFISPMATSHGLAACDG